jgi:RNA polymerase sigma-70 factor (ECF subfamily)
MAKRFTGNDSLAADVAQEVFLKVFRRLGEFRGEAEITTWLYRIVANTCIDAERSRRRLVPLEGSGVTEQPSCTPPQDGQILRQQVNARVETALATLKPKLRIVLLLRYDGDLSYDQIAEVLGCSTGAVAARLSRGHRILAKKLEGLRGVLE